MMKAVIVAAMVFATVASTAVLAKEMTGTIRLPAQTARSIAPA